MAAEAVNAAEFGTGYVCSHTGGAAVRTRPFRVSYPRLTDTVIADISARAHHAVKSGVPREGVLIDPTHDFGKNTWHSIELLRQTRDLADTGWPVLMALSNKDFIGETLDVDLHERIDGTLAATALAASAGASMFRVHEVRRNRHVLEMVATIEGSRPPARCVRGLA